MKKLLLVFGFAALFSFSSRAQDSCGLRISLLTCAPGEELYSTFGHTAVRVQAGGSDLVYNYGSFEFGPDFYMQFIRGKLLYFLAVENFDDFLYQYRYEGRSIQEQVLQLGCAEKQALQSALNANAQEDARYYRYDFLFDNCTTRAKNIISKHASRPVVFNNILGSENPSFRKLIHTYLNAGKQPWSKLGIDILLGARLDRKVSNEEAMFLPDYLLKGFDSARTGGQPLVTPPQTVLRTPPAIRNNGFFTPAVVFAILCAFIVLLSFSRRRGVQRGIRIFDFLFILVLGLAGILLLFMWFGTDHVVCRDNYNLLWALPTHTIAAFFVHRSSRWAPGYFRIVFWLSLLLLAAWFFLPQQMNNALLPVVILTAFRTWWLSKTPYAGKRVAR